MIAATDRQIADDIDIVVLAHPAKPAITAETLGELEIPYRLFENPDHEFPPDHPELLVDRSEKRSSRGYALRQYRAFRGHQEILASSESPYTLVFEDDMSLKPGVSLADVIRHVNGARHLITNLGYDAVSFHGRRQSPAAVSIGMYDHEYVELAPKVQKELGQVYFLWPVIQGENTKYRDREFAWHEGCLAYMVGPAGREKWKAAGHGAGMPCDLFLVNELRTLVMRHTIFHHDHRHGSLIANQGRAKRNLDASGALKPDK